MEALLLSFSSPFHIGTGAEELDRTEIIYHSDALKSAIFSVGLRLFPHWEQEADKRFFGAFRISSCFPYAGNELFLPRPLKFGRLGKQEQSGMAKKAKKIRFISSDVFADWVSSSEEEPFSEQRIHLTPDGQFLCAEHETASSNVMLVGVQQRVRVPLPGEKEDTRPFYLERLHFNPGCGFYFLADFGGNQDLRREVMAALRLLGEEGIGTDRTVGNGRFEFDESRHVKPFSLPESKGLGYQMALGLFLPKSPGELENIASDEAAWGLLKRGGYIAAGSDSLYGRYRKNTVYFFTPGSVFKADTEPLGSCVDLKPGNTETPVQHPIWRDGQCLFIKI